ncbi:MAG: transglutaminase family protein [Phaeovulum sp.]|uniref:transglutaminase family protein n=1 Tax=Phaeovulum sp. TaxID=2934796 RepID=UPI0027300F8D|nr:transglutaminase family protein [Phaeovulum sp.]MDP2064337.1 transglutaminase family protein [Phaeovulum sp.]
MIYDIRLRIASEYDRPAVSGRHLVCVMPLETGRGQRCVSGTLTIAPEPEERLDRLDFFGNRVTEFCFRAPQDSVTLTLLARVERLERGEWPGGSVALADLPAALAESRDLGPDSPLHFLAPSFRVPRDAAMEAFARAVLEPGMSVAAAVMAVGHALNRHLRYDPQATTVDTPAAEAFARRSGVCQDFSHIMIACLRGIGVPAGYVSGFLSTLPPPGKPRLQGADAMHAWVRAWCGPETGWIEFDPTNDRLAGGDHVVVARGRDYADVAPVKGTLRTSGTQKSRQAVDMVPLG